MTTILICAAVEAGLAAYACIALAVYQALRRELPEKSEGAERALAVLWPISAVIVLADCIGRLMEMLFDRIGGGEK